MSKSGLEQYTVRHPDYIPEGQEHLYPAMGGVFHDYIPEGANKVEVFGEESDDTKSGKAVDVDLKAEKKAKKSA